MFQTVVQQILNGLVMGGLYSLFGLGLSLIYVVVRMVNFAHGEFVMVAALITYYLTHQYHIPYVVAAFGGVVIGVALAVVVQQIAVQPLWKSPRVMALISTIGVSIFISNLVAAIAGPNPVLLETNFMQHTLSVGTIVISSYRLGVLAVALFTVVGVHLLLYHSWFGLGVRALMENPLGSQLTGVNPRRAAAMTFALAGGIAGLAGVMIAPLAILTPSMGIDMTLKGFAVLVLGGIGNVWGVILSGPIIGITESLLTAVFPSDFQTGLVFSLMMIVLLIRPEGLFTTSRT